MCLADYSHVQDLDSPPFNRPASEAPIRAPSLGRLRPAFGILPPPGYGSPEPRTPRTREARSPGRSTLRPPLPGPLLAKAVFPNCAL